MPQCKGAFVIVVVIGRTEGGKDEEKLGSY